MQQNSIKTYKITKDFEGPFSKAISSMDFSMCGRYYAMSRWKDDFISLYRTDNCKFLDRYISMPVGKDIIRFSRSGNYPLSIYHTCNKFDHCIRCVNIEDGSCLNYFGGHTQPVVFMDLKPHTNNLITSSMDQTVRIWDARSIDACSILLFKSTPKISMHPVSPLLAVNSKRNNVKLYDIRKLRSGSLRTLQTGISVCDRFDTLKFSPNGKKLLVCSNNNTMAVFDMTANCQKLVLKDFCNITQAPQEASWMMDSIHVLRGDYKGHVHVWNADCGDKLPDFTPTAPRNISNILINPTKDLFATTGTKLDFWGP